MSQDFDWALGADDRIIGPGRSQQNPLHRQPQPAPADAPRAASPVPAGALTTGAQTPAPTPAEAAWDKQMAECTGVRIPGGGVILLADFPRYEAGLAAALTRASETAATAEDAAEAQKELHVCINKVGDMTEMLIQKIIQTHRALEAEQAMRKQQVGFLLAELNSLKDAAQQHGWNLQAPSSSSWLDAAPLHGCAEGCSTTSWLDAAPCRDEADCGRVVP